MSSFQVAGIRSEIVQMPDATSAAIAGGFLLVMSRRNKREWISFTELAKAAHTFPSANEALKKYNEIVKSDGSPEIWRQGDSFGVRDGLDPRSYLSPRQYDD